MRMLLRLAVICLLAVQAVTADTILLKNGRRIRAAQVLVEGDRVSYETRAGRLSLPLSIVERIERDDYTTPDAAADVLLDPPAAVPEGFEEVARAAVANGRVDAALLDALELRARAGSAEDRARLAVANHAAAQLELGRGDVGRALEYYRRTLAVSPDQLGALVNSAYLHLRRSEFSIALDYLERARRAAPGSADAARLAGWAYYGANRLEEAAREWRRALELRSDSEVAQALRRVERDLEVERGFLTGSTAHFSLRYDGAAAPGLAREILRTLERHFDEIERELRFTPPDPIGVILYTGQAFADITRAPGWAGAINDGRLRVPVQGLTDVDAELGRVLKHELVHSFLAQKSANRCPVWLHEGVAQWMEGRRSAGAAAALVAAAGRRGTLPLRALEDSWLNLDENASAFAYAWSLAVVEYVISVHGMRDVERALDRIAAGAAPEAALREVLRMDYEELERRTVDFLRRSYFR
jgi:tetratricopeptide (TPR) repeat protein